MKNKLYHTGNTFVLDTNEQKPRRGGLSAYQIMHKDKVVASISSRGEAEIYDEQFMPYNLYLEEGYDFDILFNNARVFEYWCANRVLTLDRIYAKEILNSIGATQNPTDRDRAKISLSCHCVSLTDVHWVREEGENITFDKLNLFDNSLSESVVDLTLKGKPLTVTNLELVTSLDLAPDLSTRGMFPKAWVRQDNTFYLLKDGGYDSVRREFLASQICQCFDIPQVIYQLSEYDGQQVTKSRIITSKDFSISPMVANQDIDYIGEAIRLDPIAYYGMNILDYLTGNIDRHWENWGFLVNNTTNERISLHPLIDFNKCFSAYNNLDGTICQTVEPRRLSQRQAAIEAVQAIGLPQLREVDLSIFGDHTEEADMFCQRLAELKRFAK